jgi:bacterioferritin
MSQLDKQDEVVAVLNRLLEAELAGVVRYTHYSFLVFGFSRIPVVSWLREQANESLRHAEQVGEWITALGAYPSLAIGSLLDSHRHDTSAILKESLATEGEALKLYRQLLQLVEGRSVALEEFARQMIYTEELHAAEVDKMLRRPGEVATHSCRKRLTEGCALWRQLVFCSPSMPRVCPVTKPGPCAIRRSATHDVEIPGLAARSIRTSPMLVDRLQARVTRMECAESSAGPRTE